MFLEWLNWNSASAACGPGAGAVLIVPLPAEHSRRHSEHCTNSITVTMTKTVSPTCMGFNERHRPWHLDTDSLGLFVVVVL